jgi:hypothetical protein
VETVPVKHFMRLIVNELNAYDNTLRKERMHQMFHTEEREASSQCRHHCFSKVFQKIHYDETFPKIQKNR